MPSKQYIKIWNFTRSYKTNDIICITETKCDSLIGYDIIGYKSYFMKKSIENINMVESMVYVSLLKLNLLIIVTL